MITLISDYNGAVTQYATFHEAQFAIEEQAYQMGVRFRMEVGPSGLQRMGFDWAGVTLWWRWCAND